MTVKRDERKFNYDLDYKKLDLRRRKNLYRVGRGEQGVLLVEPYKSELLPLWKFKTQKDAAKSSALLVKAFNSYLKKNDFIGMDMARKYLQMGFTRARRYANHKSGRKYVGAVPKRFRRKSGAHGRPVAPLSLDKEKAAAARIFFKAFKKVEANKRYALKKAAWKVKYG